jgi:hypothetical protein
VIFPLFLINFLLLAICWVGGDNETILANVAMVLLVLVAYLPTVRAEVPPSPNFTYIDYIVVLLILQCFIAITPVFVENDDTYFRKYGGFDIVASAFSLWLLAVIFKLI